MDRNWKLGDDLYTDSDILHAITFDDLILALQNERDFQDPANHNATYMKKIFNRMLSSSLMQDAKFLIENNVNEILREVFPDDDNFKPKKAKPLSDEACEKLAWEIYELFHENELWQDVRIYFNDRALSTDNMNSVFRYNGEPFILEDIDPKDYFEYVNNPNIISMSFEGPVYEMFNCGEYESVHDKFYELITRHGLYYELGNAWNLSLYEN